MITNGWQCIITTQGGKKYRRLICILFLITIIMSGCSAGRGDWRHDLAGGYAITRANAHEILLVRHNVDSTSYSPIISNFYITAFCTNDAYIGIQGIPTAGIYATNEELQDDHRVRYLLEVESGNIYGPYSKQNDFDEQCSLLSTGDLGTWTYTGGVTG